MTGETAALAANLAKTCGWRVFPCHENKRPACEHGFKNATNDPDAIGELWRRSPGPLVGIATGAVSGIDVLDVDTKHDAALAWWRANQHRIPLTRSFRTRSGGMHLYLRHTPRLGCSAAKVTAGVDIRADGGYAISWFAAGFECLDHSPVALWPTWLMALLLPKPEPKQPYRPRRFDRAGDREEKAIDGILRIVASAPEGQRNRILHWSACRLGERVQTGQIGPAEAADMLTAAGTAAGLAMAEVRATIRSGLRRTTR